MYIRNCLYCNSGRTIKVFSTYLVKCNKTSQSRTHSKLFSITKMSTLYMLTHKNRMILIFLIFIFRTCQREKCRISRRKHPAIFKVTANGALISRQKFPFVKILFRDLSFGPLIFQQTAKKIIADKIFRAKM